MTIVDVARSEPDVGRIRTVSLLRELESLPSAPGTPPERRRRDDGWLDRWLDTSSDLARLQATNPMLDAVIDEIDGRRIRVGDHWLSDFASCNYHRRLLGRRLAGHAPPGDDVRVRGLDRVDVRPRGLRPGPRRLAGDARRFMFNALEAAGTVVWLTTKPRLVPRALLGRVSSFDWFISTGLVPLSFAVVAPVTAAIGARSTFLDAGTLGAVVTLAFLFVPGVRQVDGDAGQPGPETEPALILAN